MNKMLKLRRLLYAGKTTDAWVFGLSNNRYRKYVRRNEFLSDMPYKDLTIMLLLIAAAEGYEL